jgi:hypothetical protein
MTKPTNLGRGWPRQSSAGLGGSITPPPSDDVTYGGHVGTDVEAALDGRPPTHTSASDPTTGDDSGDGHVIGCRWINTATDEEFVVTDVTVAAAVWQSTTSGSGGSVDVTDGTTTVSPASTIDFDPTYFDVTAPGGGVAEVTFVGSAGGDLDDLGDVDAPTPSDGDVLTFDSGSGDWVNAAPSGGGGDYEFISETVLGSDQTDITITGIPNTYRALRIFIVARVTSAGEFGTLNLRMGDGSIDTGGTVYSSSRRISGSGAADFGGRAGSLINLATVPAASATSGAFAYIEATVLNYANTSAFKGILFQGYMDGATDHYQQDGGGQYRSTSAEVDQIRIYIDMSQNLLAGSSMAIYGIT